MAHSRGDTKEDKAVCVVLDKKVTLTMSAGALLALTSLVESGMTPALKAAVNADTLPAMIPLLNVGTYIREESKKVLDEIKALPKLPADVAAIMGQRPPGEQVH